jgi:hypothetical protein
MKRWLKWERRELIKDLPAHHLANHGGVLIQKEFIGYEKCHSNDTSLMNWYKMAYSRVFKETVAE